MRPDEVFIGRECDETGRWDFRPFAGPAFNDVKIHIRTSIQQRQSSFRILINWKNFLPSTEKKKVNSVRFPADDADDDDMFDV